MSKADRAYALAKAKDWPGAMRVINDTLNKDPEDISMIMVSAYVMMGVENWGMAYNQLKYVLHNSPNFAEIYNNLGMACASLSSCTGKDKYLDEAGLYLRRALKKILTPDGLRRIAKGEPDPRPAIYNNLALVAVNKSEFEAAEEFARESLKIEPEHKDTLETLSYAQLAQGKWKEGFFNYEWALGGKHRQPSPAGDEDYWLGGTGQNIYVRGEQGIGDEITYASVLHDAMKHNTITLECDARLEGLFKRSFPDLEIYGTRFDKNANWMSSRKFDAHCLIGSLCREYRHKDEDFPRTPFLIPDPERRAQWRVLLDKLPGKKVGIAWTGGLPNTFQSRRSFNLEGLLPILKTPGITFVSLQYKDPSGEIEALKAKHGIEVKHWARAAQAHDFDEPAALIAELDAVVTVTTATAHLCGAIGQKAYVLVPSRCRWFYRSDSEKHRWYDSLELFKQEDRWPIERLAHKLKADLNGA